MVQELIISNHPESQTFHDICEQDLNITHHYRTKDNDLCYWPLPRNSSLNARLNCNMEAHVVLTLDLGISMSDTHYFCMISGRCGSFIDPMNILCCDNEGELTTMTPRSHFLLHRHEFGNEIDSYLLHDLEHDDEINLERSSAVTVGVVINLFYVVVLVYVVLVAVS